MQNRYVATLVMTCVMLVLMTIPAWAEPSADDQIYEVFFTTEIAPFVGLACNLAPDGRSYFQYTASGVATGPYPGTFVEHGAVWIGPQSLNGPAGSGIYSGIVLDWRASFVITIDDGTEIYGSKNLGTTPGAPSTPPNGWGRCVVDSTETPYPLPDSFKHGDQSAHAALRYYARIPNLNSRDYSIDPRLRARSVVFYDTGISTAVVSQSSYADEGRHSSFESSFLSDFGAAGCPQPTPCLSSQ